MEEFYRAAVEGVASPISPEDVLTVAVARDALSSRFLSGDDE
jgi:hypothetical protein